MNNNYTDITILLDRSGSMETIKAQTLAGTNKFINDQKVSGEELKTALDGRRIDLDDEITKSPMICKLTLIQFSTGSQSTTYLAQDVNAIAPLTEEQYQTNGGTALIDAFCEVIDATGARLAALPEDQRPGRVIFISNTDGEENSSRRFSRKELSDRIKHQEQNYNWQFLYLGANQDAVAEAEGYNISADSALTYAATDHGIASGYNSLSDTVLRKRSVSTASMNMMNFVSSDRDEQADELNQPIAMGLTADNCNLNGNWPKIRPMTDKVPHTIRNKSKKP